MTTARAKTNSGVLSTTGKVILAASIELFGSRGYHGTSMRDIATSVGLQPGALYNHFPGKQDILFRIVEDGLWGMHAEVREAVIEADTPSAKLVAFVKNHVRIHGQQQELAIVIDRELGALSPPNRRVAKKIRMDYENVLIRVLKDGMAGGDFRRRDPRLTAYAIIGMGTEVAVWFNPAGRLKLWQIEDAYAEMAAAILTSPATARSQ